MSSNQSRLLLSQVAGSANAGPTTNSSNSNSNSKANSEMNEPQDSSNQYSVDTDFDSYWEEEARYPHRNRIRIGRQYQATVPPLISKSGEKDHRRLEDLETLSFCPKRSARVSNNELDHYFKVAKSLNLFASLVETRSLLGRDVTIADLNHIRHKEGLSLASVIQPVRQAAVTAMNNISSITPMTSSTSAPSSTPAQPSLSATTSVSTATTSSNSQAISSYVAPTSSMNSNSSQLATQTQQSTSRVQSTSSPTDSSPTTATAATSLNSPPSNCETTTQPQQLSPTNETSNNPSQTASQNIHGNVAINQPLMRALSHFISLHHPCHHDTNCKKLLKDIPLEDNSTPTVNLRQGSSNAKRARTAAKQQQLQQQQQQQNAKLEQSSIVSDSNSEQQLASVSGISPSDNAQQLSPSYKDWTREEVELFSKAIEVCGKNFGSIKKEFLPTKSVKSIVEYYYIGSRDVPDSKKQKSYQNTEAHDACSGPEKSSTGNNNGKSGGGGGGGSSSGSSGVGGGPAASSNYLTASSVPSSNGPSSTVATTTSTASPSAATTSSRTTTSNSSNTNELGKTNSKTSSSYIYSSVKPEPDVKTTPPPQMSNKSHSSKSSSIAHGEDDTSDNKSKQAKNIDARMSVYNFDEDLKDESPVKFECPRPGAEVRPLKAKPIMPNASNSADMSNSNVGSLKFFMDGQLVLKLNARQEQQEGIERCHWVPSGERTATASRQKRYTKRSNDKSAANADQTSSQSSSVISSNQDEDSKNNEDLSGDEDSKESMNSFTNSNLTNASSLSINATPTLNANTSISPAATQASPRNHSGGSTTPRSRSKTKNSAAAAAAAAATAASTNHQSAESIQPTSPNQQVPPQMPSPIDYNRLAINNRMKELKDNLFNQQAMNQANPWLQANSFAVAAALLGRIPFPPGAASGLIDNPNLLATNSGHMNMHSPVNSNNLSPGAGIVNNTNNVMNYPSSKPMDLSVEHNPIQTTPPTKPVSTTKSRSRARPKNNH